MPAHPVKMTSFSVHKYKKLYLDFSVNPYSAQAPCTEYAEAYADKALLPEILCFPCLSKSVRGPAEKKKGSAFIFLPNPYSEDRFLPVYRSYAMFIFRHSDTVIL